MMESGSGSKTPLNPDPKHWSEHTGTWLEWTCSQHLATQWRHRLKRCHLIAFGSIYQEEKSSHRSVLHFLPNRCLAMKLTYCLWSRWTRRWWRRMCRSWARQRWTWAPSRCSPPPHPGSPHSLNNRTTMMSPASGRAAGLLQDFSYLIRRSGLRIRNCTGP